MRRRLNIKHTIGLALMLISMGGWAMLSSCVNDDHYDCPSADQGKEETVYLQFRLTTGAASAVGTRAIGDEQFDGDDHAAEGGLAAENYLTPDDMRIYLFNSSNGLLIEELTPQTTLNDATGTLLTAKVSMRPEMVMDANEYISFSIMVLANWKSIGAEYPTVIPVTTTLSNMENIAEYTFTMTQAWQPQVSTTAANGIPMYGRQDYSGIPLSRIRETSFENPLPLYPSIPAEGFAQKNIQMLRCVAKMEVADNIDRPATGTYPLVTAVSLVNYQENGLFIPRPGSFADGFNQVRSSSLPSVAVMGTRPFVKVNKYATAADANGVDWDTLFDSWWTTYLPEMNYTNAAAETAKFQLAVTVAFSETDSRVYYANVPQFPTSEGMILRNHIYRIQVSLTRDVDVTLRYGICPWDVYTVDIPAFE